MTRPDMMKNPIDAYTQGKTISISQTHNGPLVLGGTGRVGRMLAAVWPQEMPAPLWQRRASAAAVQDDDLIWDILATVPPALPRPVTAVIVLAGVTHGTPQALQQNTALAQAGRALARTLGVKTLIASSQAVYGRQKGALSETDSTDPVHPYGQAKRDMERAVSGQADVTCLRIGNVAGCDGLFQAMARGPVQIDQFPDGQSPRRMMIGPRDLARTLASLSATHTPLPPVLNVASPGLLAMSDMAAAAGAAWGWKPAPQDALPVLEMDVSALLAHIALPRATAKDIVTQARAGGWKPAL